VANLKKPKILSITPPIVYKNQTSSKPRQIKRPNVIIIIEGQKVIPILPFAANFSLMPVWNSFLDPVSD